LPRANRTAKPISSDVSFGCSKFFLTVDTGEQLFKCGLQVERGYVKAPPESRSCQLRADWDWHRLIEALKPASALERELERLVLHEGFMLRAGGWEEHADYARAGYPGVLQLRKALETAPKNGWADSNSSTRCGRAKCRLDGA